MAIFVKFLSSIVSGLVCAVPAVMSCSSRDPARLPFGFFAFVIGSFLGLFFGRLIVKDSTKPNQPREVK